MGYMLNSLGNLPVERDVSLYIFIVNGNWKGGLHETIERNFAEIARSIGPNAGIVKGLNENWTSEVASRYFGEDHGELLAALPALLLTDAHPDLLTDESLRLIIPLHRIEELFGTWDSFFRGLKDFALRRDSTFLKKFEDAEDFINTGNSILDLKPNIFGIGVNLNAAIDRWRKGPPE